MKLIITNETRPGFNLAAEEYLLKQTQEDIFFLWRNAPAVIIGKNQNAYSEIDIDYVKKNNITVIRRLTGGGAVFHDLGNICFTFIANVDDDEDVSFQRFTKPIADFLKTLGVEAQFAGRNDIEIDGQKISGNAQTKYKNRFMHHGTLLFSSSMNDMSKALTVNPLKIQSKGIKSVKARVTNISAHLKEKMDVESFMQKLFDFALENTGGERYGFNETDLAAISRLYDEKYNTWGWNFGENPDYTFKKTAKFQGGLIEADMNIAGEKIEKISISGDFFAYGEIGELEDKLTGAAHNEAAIEKILRDVDLKNYIGAITKDEFISLLF